MMKLGIVPVVATAAIDLATLSTFSPYVASCAECRQQQRVRACSAVWGGGGSVSNDHSLASFESARRGDIVACTPRLFSLTLIEKMCATVKQGPHTAPISGVCALATVVCTTAVNGFFANSRVQVLVDHQLTVQQSG